MRKYDALANDMLIPLRSATYAAMQSGHFGMNASSAPGTIHCVSFFATFSTFVFVMTMHPCLRFFAFVAALRSEVEKVVGRVQKVDAPRIA